MPAVSVNPLPVDRTHDSTLGNPMPSLIHTPSGLAMIELQGTISSEQPEVAEAITLGRLVFPPAEGNDNGPWDGKRVMLYVGDHQRLTGEMRKLPKPIAVIRRKAIAAGSDSAGVEDEVEIAEIVYYKMLFKNRPEPLGGQQQQPEGI